MMLQFMEGALKDSIVKIACFYLQCECECVEHDHCMCI